MLLCINGTILSVSVTFKYCKQMLNKDEGKRQLFYKKILIISIWWNVRYEMSFFDNLEGKVNL